MKKGRIIAVAVFLVGVVAAAIFTNAFINALDDRIDVALLCYAHCGVVTAFHGLFCAIFYKTVLEKCHILTSLTSLALSVCAGFGGSCFFTMASAMVFSEPHLKHPLDQICGAFGMIVFMFGFLALFYLYATLRGKRPSKLGVLFDVIFALNYVPTFFIIFGACVYPLAKALIKG